MTSKKTVLKETPNLRTIKPYRKTDNLQECINTILRRDLLHLNVKKVCDLLTHDLNINVKNISPRMKFVLAECLCYYMKMWPGWKQYEAVCTNERSKMEYTEKFKEYLIFKIEYIMGNERMFSPETANKERPATTSTEVQTDPICKKNKPEAPYSLVISGQPNVLNNIVFIEIDNNIIVKQHAEKAWKPLNAAEFLNYSFVFVSIKLPDIELSRSNLHEFQRYITECGDSVSCPEVDFIAYIRKRYPNVKSKVYSRDYIHAYFKQLMDIIKTLQGVNPVKITELEELFRQFILDIEESNVYSSTSTTGQIQNTMATNTSVCFNIGQKTYVRNKKMVVSSDNKKAPNAINFCEILIPRMAYSLDRFNAEEDITTDDTSFQSLNQLKALDKNSTALTQFVEAVNSCVTYQCLLCPKSYSGERAYIEVLDHYRFLHKGEQCVLCFTCRKQFSIGKLAGDRWSHICTMQPGRASSGLSNDSGAIGITDILSSKESASTITLEDLRKKDDLLELPGASAGIPNILEANETVQFLPLVNSSTPPASAPVPQKIQIQSLPTESVSYSAPVRISNMNNLNSVTVTNLNNIKSDVSLQPGGIPNFDQTVKQYNVTQNLPMVYTSLSTSLNVSSSISTIGGITQNMEPLYTMSTSTQVPSVNLEQINVGPLVTIPVVTVPVVSTVTTPLGIMNTMSILK